MGIKCYDKYELNYGYMRVTHLKGDEGRLLIEREMKGNENK